MQQANLVTYKAIEPITTWSCSCSCACRRFLSFRFAFSLLYYCFNTIEQYFNAKTLLRPLWFGLSTVNKLKSSKTYFSVRILILSARVKCLKGELEHDKDDYRYYAERIALKCKDEKMNADLSITSQLSVEG